MNQIILESAAFKHDDEVRENLSSYRTDNIETQYLNTIDQNILSNNFKYQPSNCAHRGDRKSEIYAPLIIDSFLPNSATSLSIFAINRIAYLKNEINKR